MLPSIRETGEQLPVAHLAIALLSDILQNDHAFRWKGTPESLRGVLHEGFHPACDASGPPEFGAGWLGQGRHKMISDSLAGQGEKWPVPFVVKLQVTGGPSLKGSSMLLKTMVAFPTVTVCSAMTQVLLFLLDDWLSSRRACECGEARVALSTSLSPGLRTRVGLCVYKFSHH